MINILEKLKVHKFLVFALVFALFNMGAIFLIFGFQVYGDTPSYFEAISWFQGEEVEVLPWRILRPLGPLIAVPFEFLGQGAGLIVQNIVFYLLCAFLIFKITELVYHNKKQAFFASLFFVTATPVIEVGLAYLTDTGAWFFYLFSIFLTLLYLKNRKEKLIAFNGLLAGLGFLMKESGALGVLFFGLMILFSRCFNIKEKIFKILHFGIFFLIPIAILQIFMFKYFHFTSLDWYSIGKAGLGEEGLLLTSFRYLGQLFRVLGILWLLVLIGIWKEWQEKNWQRIKIFLALLLPSFSFLFWSLSGGGRVVFIFAPLGILLATHGLTFLDNKLGKKRGTLLIVLLFATILILNYSFCWFNSTISFTDIFAKFLGIL